MALLASVVSMAGGAVSAVAQEAAKVLEAEEATTLKIEPPQAQWGYIRGGFGSGGTRIFDGVTGKMKGLVETSKSSDMAIDPAGKFYYVSESIWTKGDRGTRQDMVSVYDTTDMKLLAEITMPGRLIIGGRKQNFIISDDGKTGFVYNFDPASSVNVIDLVKRKFVTDIDLPGCASLMPNPGVGFSALCSDGSIATVAVNGSKSSVTRSASFFAASVDPIFDNYTYDQSKAEAVMVSYTGLVYQVKVSATPTVSAPWSLQVAAGLRPGDTKPLDVNWFPGGTQPMALNRKTGLLYVLMHIGEFWSQKQAGTEVWEIDVAAKKVLGRHPLEKPAVNIEVTQSAEPLLFLSEDEGGNARVIDAKTWESKHEIKRAGGGIINTFFPR